MRRVESDLRTDGNDTRRIDLRMAHIIVPLDVIEIYRLFDPRPLIKLAQIVRKIWIVGDPAQIAFEVTDINRIETNERREQPPVGFSDAIASEIAASR